jgi:hypothetical protein
MTRDGLVATARTARRHGALHFDEQSVLRRGDAKQGQRPIARKDVGRCPCALHRSSVRSHAPAPKNRQTRFECKSLCTEFVDDPLDTTTYDQRFECRSTPGVAPPPTDANLEGDRRADGRQVLQRANVRAMPRSGHATARRTRGLRGPIGPHDPVDALLLDIRQAEQRRGRQ